MRGNVTAYVAPSQSVYKLSLGRMTNTIHSAQIYDRTCTVQCTVLWVCPRVAVFVSCGGLSC